MRGWEALNNDKVIKIKNYIKKGIIHYRELCNYDYVNILKNILNYINNEVINNSPTNPDTVNYIEIVGIIPTTFNDFRSCFYQELLAVDNIIIYIEESNLEAKKLRVVGNCNVNIINNLIHVRGRVDESIGTNYNHLVLIQDEDDSPAVLLTRENNTASNIKYVLKG